MNDKIAFVYGSDCDDILKEAQNNQYAPYLDFIMIDEFVKNPQLFSQNHKILLCGEIAEIKSVIELAEEGSCSLGLIPKKKQHALRESFHLSNSIQENITLAMENESRSIDLLVGAGKVVLYSAQIGDTPPLSYSASQYEEKKFAERLQDFFGIFKKFKTLQHAKLKLRTLKQQEITTVGSGIVIVEHDNHTMASRIVQEDLSINDGQLSALLISPPSIMGYLGFLVRGFFTKPKKGSLHAHIGHIKSERLEIESEPPLPVKIDGEEAGSTPVSFEVHKKVINMSLPSSFWEKEGSVAEKETVKLGNLVTSQEAVSYRQAALPLFTHASEEQFQSLFVSLREEAKASSTFMTLIFLSTLLATVGLYLNSASVIIGAMLLAPLMQPIVSFSMGLLRRDQSIFTLSLRTIIIGVLIAVVSSSLFTLMMPFDTLTAEMQGRLKPSLLDLMVALIAGVAAAYAKNNEKIIGSLVGVSIAVALVPPIAVAGIGLGWMNFYMFSHAFLLFLTNLAGIVFAASMLFLMQGFSPIHSAKRGLFISLIGALVISIPLYFSFQTIRQDAKIKSALLGTVFHIHSRDVRLESIQLSHTNGILHIKCDMISKGYLTIQEKQEIKNKITHALHEQVILEAVERVEF